MGITNQVKINLYYLINIEFFKSNFISLKAFKGLSIEDKQIISFLSNLEIDIAAREFEQQETRLIFNELKKTL